MVLVKVFIVWNSVVWREIAQSYLRSDLQNGWAVLMKAALIEYQYRSASMNKLSKGYMRRRAALFAGAALNVYLEQLSNSASYETNGGATTTFALS